MTNWLKEGSKYSSEDFFCDENILQQILQAKVKYVILKTLNLNCYIVGNIQ